MTEGQKSTILSKLPSIRDDRGHLWGPITEDGKRALICVRCLLRWWPDETQASRECVVRL